MLDGHRSVLGFTMELHMIAAAAHELLRLRSNTPTLPIDDGTDELARARAEWDRRHVVATQAEAALVDRIAALRAYEQALTPIGTALNNLQGVTELATVGGRWTESSGRSPAPTTPCETTSTTSEPVSTPRSLTSTVSSAHTTTPEHTTKRTAHKQASATPLRDALPSKGFWFRQSVVESWLR